MKSIDIRSEGAVNLLAEFLDMDSEAAVGANANFGSGRTEQGLGDGRRRNAEHFAHGEYTIIDYSTVY